ncbi:MAG TPA: DUF1858 domain-containing protein [Bacteroidota bacterium]|nr:DUF1858 domain-containing protein [Bacteroidota bacterium]
MIRRDISIEELVTILPESVRYLMDRGIKPIVCGEPIWDTLEGAARAKGFSDERIDEMVRELAELFQQKQNVLHP